MFKVSEDKLFEVMYRFKPLIQEWMMQNNLNKDAMYIGVPAATTDKAYFEFCHTFRDSPESIYLQHKYYKIRITPVEMDSISFFVCYAPSETQDMITYRRSYPVSEAYADL